MNTAVQKLYKNHKKDFHVKLNVKKKTPQKPKPIRKDVEKMKGKL